MGGLALVLLVLLVLFLIRRRRNTLSVREPSPAIEPQPAGYTSSPSLLLANSATFGSPASRNTYQPQSSGLASFTGSYDQGSSSAARLAYAAGSVGANDSSAAPSATGWLPEHPPSIMPLSDDSRRSLSSTISSAPHHTSFYSPTAAIAPVSMRRSMAVTNPDNHPRSLASSAGLRPIKQGEEDTQRQINALRAEVDRLRADRPDGGFAPPAYENTLVSSERG